MKSFALLTSASLPLLLVLACPPPPEEAPADAGPDAGPDAGSDAGPASTCGDGRVDGSEECDDGDTLQTNACKNDCTFNICGDSHVLEGVEECDVGDRLNGDGCSAVCLLEPPPLPDAVTFTGVIRDRAYADAATRPLDRLEVRPLSVTCADAPCAAAATDANGRFVVEGLPAQSTFFIDARFPPRTGNEALYAQGGPLYAERYQRAGYATVSPAATGPEAVTEHSGYMVRYSWLEQVAVECGIYTAGTWSSQTPTHATGHPDWAEYSAFIGFLKDAGGAPVAGVPPFRIEVKLDDYLNNNPANVCFLTKDAAGVYRGSTATASSVDGGGGFVVFKAKNSPDGFGSGSATVQVAFAAGGPNFSRQLLPMSAGSAGLFTLTTRDPAPPVVEVMDFDADIYPMMTALSCTVCHRADAAAGSLLRFDDTPEAVYTALTSRGTICGATAYRVCVNEPERSLMLSKPLLEEPPNHPNASFTSVESPDYVRLKAWIEQGAVR